MRDIIVNLNTKNGKIKASIELENNEVCEIIGWFLGREVFIRFNEKDKTITLYDDTTSEKILTTKLGYFSYKKLMRIFKKYKYNLNIEYIE